MAINFSYHGFTFGIFTVDIISMYFLSCPVVLITLIFLCEFFFSYHIILFEFKPRGVLVTVYLGDPDFTPVSC